MDIKQNKVVSFYIFDYPATICSIDSKGKFLAVALENGLINIFADGELTKEKLKKKVKVCMCPDKDVVSVIDFSPKGDTFLAAYAPPFCEIIIFET